MKGIYLCPTPIGNLEDITLRTINILKSVDFIACEDTRTSKVLLDKYEINKPLVSYHKFNYKSRIPKIIEELKSGKTCAIITDAGMPGISDPGSEIILDCVENGIEINVLPGPSAFIVALVLSGLDTNRFTFIGFLPEKNSQRLSELENLKDYKETLIFYEAPHRLRDFLSCLYEVFGDRRISISRELTKYYEETIRGRLADILDSYESITEKGEFVIVIEGNTDISSEVDIEKELIALLEQGYTKRDAVKKLSNDFGLKKNEVYEVSLRI